MSLYARVIDVAGVPVKCGARVKSWGGWPDDVRETLRRWNRGRLSFYGMDWWGGTGAGFAKPSEKCSECGEFFNNSGTTACWLRNGSGKNGRWVCDDCIVALARLADSRTPLQTEEEE